MSFLIKNVQISFGVSFDIIITKINKRSWAVMNNVGVKEDQCVRIQLSHCITPSTMTYCYGSAQPYHPPAKSKQDYESLYRISTCIELSRNTPKVKTF